VGENQVALVSLISGKLKSASYSTIPRDVLVIDEEGFRRYLKKTGHIEKRCDYEVHNVKRFEKYLSRHKNKKLGEEKPEDLARVPRYVKEEVTLLKIGRRELIPPYSGDFTRIIPAFSVFSWNDSIVFFARTFLRGFKVLL
jgi:hypothetical protein